MFQNDDLIGEKKEKLKLEFVNVIVESLIKHVRPKEILVTIKKIPNIGERNLELEDFMKKLWQMLILLILKLKNK
jgi:hypothetical protein